MVSLLLLLALASDPTTHSYGPHGVRNTLDLWVPDGEGPHPVVLFVHGGAWVTGSKAAVGEKTAFLDDGYAVASCNYRLVANPLRPGDADPETRVADQAADVAAAIGWLADHAAEQRLDAGRIVLMGHSAGAHLAALVASDPQYLGIHGRRPSDLAGVVLLDGAGYDVTERAANAEPTMRAVYRLAFSADEARQRGLSPVAHAGNADTPPMLILYVARRPESRYQSEALAAAVREGGGTVTVIPFEGESHSSINRRLGTEGHAPTAVVRRFLFATAIGGAAGSGQPPQAVGTVAE